LGSRWRYSSRSRHQHDHLLCADPAVLGRVRPLCCLLAADQRGLPGQDPWPGDGRGDHRQLGANFVVSVSFLTLLGAIGDDGTFFLFGFLTLVALVYFYRQVPETKNRTLAEIERDLGLPASAPSQTAPERPAA
jgi:hypothetical protein